MKVCSEEGCEQSTWCFGKCRTHAMTPLGQEDPEDREDDKEGIEE